MRDDVVLFQGADRQFDYYMYIATVGLKGLSVNSTENTVVGHSFQFSYFYLGES